MHKKLLISISFLAMMLFAGLAAAAEVVNINKASAAAIQQNLVGIGPIKAEAIVSYRKKNGKFKSLDDLQNVTGLGPALIKKNKRYLSMTKGVVAGDDKAYAAAKKKAGTGKATSTKKPAKKQAAAKKSDKNKSKAESKTKGSKANAKKSKSAKNDCSSSNKTMSKAEKKACAKKAKSKKKTSAKKPAKKKTTTKKPAKKKKKKKSKPAS